MEFNSMASLIVFYANLLNFDPAVALAVAKVESSLNPSAIGGQGEIGLFQLKPQFVKPSVRTRLLNPHINAITGIARLKEEKEKCLHNGGLTYLVCYNYGRTNARRVVNPNAFPYVIKVTTEYNNIKRKETSWLEFDM